MLEFRVTKYDPALRDATGAYLGDDWIFGIEDIGRVFNGVALTQREYERVESAYVTTAIKLLEDAGITTLILRDLYNQSDVPLTVADNEQLSLTQVAGVLKSVLRGEFWCTLEHAEAFIHVGWDYYMYVGVPTASDAALALGAEQGLFVEPFESPYKDDGAA